MSEVDAGDSDGEIWLFDNEADANVSCNIGFWPWEDYPDAAVVLRAADTAIQAAPAAQVQRLVREAKAK
jgi:hypothetical protein